MLQKLPILILALALCGASAIHAEAESEKLDPDQIKTKVNTYLDQKNPGKAIEFLKEIIQNNPKDGASQARLGLIYALILADKKEGMPYLIKGWELGDINGLEGLGTILMLEEGQDKIILNKYKDDFITHFKRLRLAKGAAFYYVNSPKDRELFNKLLKDVSFDEIDKNAALAKSIAKAVKTLSSE